MARKYSPRPLTSGVVTIWYRAPELLLGTKRYTPSVDMWSAGLVLAEMLLSVPCLTGETSIEQLSLIIKLIGSPTPVDLASLTALGCPELIRWRQQGPASGRADNMERKFLAETSIGTVNVLKGLLRWDPHARWTAAETLGNGKNAISADAERWWKESPRGVEREFLPTYSEVRNTNLVERSRGRGKQGLVESAELGHGKKGEYMFDFGEQSAVQRPWKRSRG